MSNAKGIDISHWSGDINWGVTKNYVDFVIVKASEATNYKDIKFDINKAGLQTYNIPWGAYHFFRSNYGGAAQADKFVNSVGSGCNIYFCDVETWDGQSGSTIFSRVKAFLDRLQQLTGKKGAIYTSPGFWNALAITPPSWTNDYDLWVANWYVNTPQLPKGWSSWKVWQYSAIGSISGIPSATDLDEFNGDVYAAENYFNNGIVPEPEEYPLVSITAYKLNVRNAPWGTVIGSFPQNTVVAVTGEKKDSSGRLWYISGHAYFASWYTEPV